LYCRFDSILVKFIALTVMEIIEYHCGILPDVVPGVKKRSGATWSSHAGVSIAKLAPLPTFAPTRSISAYV